MSTSTRSTGRVLWVATRAMILFTLVLGVGYTLLVTGIGQLVLPAQADGSLVRDGDGQVVGSALIGQPFTDADGAPLPEYFQPRPSAAGDGYDGGASSGSNLGPENEDLVAAIEERRDQVAQLEGVDVDDVPADAVTASASGLDPHVSPAYAALQVERVADARGMSAGDVEALVARHTEARALGFLGEPVVHVLELNIALDQMQR
ncbi:K(+)-transporting ATPase subunit C [Cellulomonas shaoxiangyii]|uniref:Potassium-transporting ATPase KdpC subunit n=1 Tax=Cellulomonas shaoxiangyii TaxID=2566013 RepID=A0A4P7SHS1_9CELL|nr:K(+)-transporting ATPase subunit C [Cellulomonas shaoxiangyii]QCB93550.1 K(+)-transporting ATPase subunit C [Cellulomonas shaoxiangyii]TGY86872.1 K(+)-transporting ATPase subunit C [Cellulomonas shaoxiangyii]